MTITAEPKEIAELVELLARRDSAKEIKQTIEDNLTELVDKISAHLAIALGLSRAQISRSD